LNLTSHQPLIAKEHILLIESEYDLFAPRETVEELWKAWRQPEIWRYGVSHVSVLGVPGVAARAARWLATQARAHAAK
jgi:hypothetical protein